MRFVVSNALAIAENLGLTSNDVGLNAIPLFHIGGIMTNLLASLASGGLTIFLSKFDVPVFFGALANKEHTQPTFPTILSAVEAYASEDNDFQTYLQLI